MSKRHVTARVPEELFEAIEEVREAEQTDRSTVVKRLLERGIEDWRVETAIRRYRDGEASMGRAVEIADVSRWRFIDILDERGIEVNYTEDDLAADLDAVRDR